MKLTKIITTLGAVAMLAMAGCGDSKEMVKHGARMSREEARITHNLKSRYNVCKLTLKKCEDQAEVDYYEEYKKYRNYKKACAAADEKTSGRH